MVRLSAKAIVSSLVVVAAIIAPLATRADYPEKTMTIVVPYPPGGSVDITARLLATKLSETFKQTVIVENRPGAAGMIASRTVARSEPNGYTVLIDSAGVVMNPSRFRKPLYDPMKDLAPVARLIAFPYVVVIHQGVPGKNIRELTDYLKKNPRRINVATSGATGQLVGELFRLLQEVEVTFVPYKGSAPAITATVAGDTQLMFSDIPSVVQHVAGGRLRALAVTSEKRAAMLPDVPTTKEAGMPNYVVVAWLGSYVSFATPPDIVSKLNAAFNRALMQPDVVSKFAAIGAEPFPASVETFNRFYREEYERWKQVITAAKIPLVD